MTTLGKNIGISQPRAAPPRPNQVKALQSRYEYPNSIKNSYYNTLNFGTPNGSNRKLKTYNHPQATTHNMSNLTGQQQRDGVTTTAKVNMQNKIGQMDRLNRIKALAINQSK
tara:strand:+ start:517 stop:852 length:336 start_codon:yes stop_codon:yes gene_type:complete